MQRKIITTGDGSHSLYVEGLDEHYHSVHGALQESKHVFIKTGLHHIAEFGKELWILEIGLGTGLNALLTWIEAEELNLKIHYVGLEAFPLSKEVIEQLNYSKEICRESPFGEVILKKKMFSIHDADWEKEMALSENFHLTKINSTLQGVELKNRFDLIYFDAFGPRVQPEMWTDEIFVKIAGAMNENAVLVTYCSKGDVRRSMMKAGLRVEKTPGPPGKRDMVRAVRN